MTNVISFTSKSPKGEFGRLQSQIILPTNAPIRELGVTMSNFNN